MCVCVCIDGHTVGPTELIFGMEDHIYPLEVLSYILFRYPNPQGRGGGQRVVLEVRAAQTVHFCENFIKQKLKGAPANGGGDGSRQTSPRCPTAGVEHAPGEAGYLAVIGTTNYC